MSPSHTVMVMDQDGLWSWELSDQEKLYQGMREGRKHGIEKGKEEGRTDLGAVRKVSFPLYTCNSLPSPAIPSHASLSRVFHQPGPLPTVHEKRRQVKPL